MRNGHLDDTKAKNVKRNKSEGRCAARVGGDALRETPAPRDLCVCGPGTGALAADLT